MKNLHSVFNAPFSRLLFMVFMILQGGMMVYADALEIQPGNAYVEVAENGEGFNLYIRAVDGLGSILITESSADPLKQTDNYALRAWDYNPVNGNEKRILNGEFLESERPLYFLVDSTPEPNRLLGRAFKIYVPYQLTYGYPWSREGQIDVHRGTWLNIRAFQLPYADYSGVWRDNPFVLSMKVIPPAPEPEPEPPVSEISELQADNIEEAVEDIARIISSKNGQIDVVLAVDTTISMKDDLNFVRKSLVPLVRSQVENFSQFRVGLVFYRDYKEAYLTRSMPFTSNLDEIQQYLNLMQAAGGRDLPEAVDEALFAALTEFNWEASERIIIQIGDAPAHANPRGAITPEMVQKEALNLGVSIYPIKLPAK